MFSNFLCLSVSYKSAPGLGFGVLVMVVGTSLLFGVFTAVVLPDFGGFCTGLGLGGGDPSISIVDP
jgi:hypothetical protein